MLFLFIAGQSGSCKTWFADLLFSHLNSQNIRTKIISMDDYYKPKEELGGGVINYDKLGWTALDLTRFFQDLNQLNHHQTAHTPIYSFMKEGWLDETRAIDPAEVDVVIIEGIFALKQFSELDGIHNRLNFFIESDSYLEYMGRRVTRDITERGKTMEEIKTKELKAFGVRNTFFSSILPTRVNADFTVTYNNRTSRDAVLAEVMPEIMQRVESANVIRP